MGHWNHRVVKRTHPEPSGETSFQIHEAYYGLRDDGKPAITVEPKAAYGETLEELRETLQRMLKALDKPVLDYETREEIHSMMSPEEAYKYDGTFRRVVDSMRSLLSTYHITAVELRQAAVLAATMHEMENIKPLIYPVNPQWGMDTWWYTGHSYPQVFIDEAENIPPAVFGGEPDGCVYGSTASGLISGTIAPFTEHVFSRPRSDHRVCVRCSLSDTYVMHNNIVTCKGV